MLIEPLCIGRRCVVVGSAPSVLDDIAALRPRGAVVIGANGGGRIAYDMFGRLDVLVTTTYLFQRQLPHESNTVRALEGLNVQSLWVDVKSGTEIIPVGPAGINREHYYIVTPGERDRVVNRCSNGITSWVSTGVWAMCLAHVSGAVDIQVAGIDPSSVGHYEISSPLNRDHVAADTEVLQCLM